MGKGDNYFMKRKKIVPYVDEGGRRITGRVLVTD